MAERGKSILPFCPRIIAQSLVARSKKDDSLFKRNRRAGVEKGVRHSRHLATANGRIKRTGESFSSSNATPFIVTTYRPSLSQLGAAYPVLIVSTLAVYLCARKSHTPEHGDLHGTDAPIFFHYSPGSSCCVRSIN